MAVVGRGGGDFDGGGGGGGLLGLKMIVSPELVSGGDGETKMFILVPEHVRTVRELKSHLSTVVLKTSLPFYFYNGEFRIPDEDDVRIFTLLEEPCRVVPVPQRRSALAVMCSTPMPRGSSNGNNNSSIAGTSGVKKQVQFFRTAESSDESPIHGSIERRLVVESGTDQTDTNKDTLNKEETKASSSSGSGGGGSSSGGGKRSRTLAEYDEHLPGSEILERKKKRRRHRKKKNKNVNEDDYTVENMDIESSVAESPSGISSSSSSTPTSNGMRNGSGTSPTAAAAAATNEKVVKTHSRRRLVSSSDEDASSETSTTQIVIDSKPASNIVPQQTKSESSVESGVFLTPSSIVTTKRIRKSQTYNSSSSTMGSSLFDKISGKRQDTPILPRVLKNPGINYEAVRRSLSMKLDETPTDGLLGNTSTSSARKQSPSTSPGVSGSESEAGRKMNGSKINLDGGNDIDMLMKLPEIIDIGLIKEGNIIAFKVVELNEDYTPDVSAFKTARVIDKVGDILSLEYILTDVKTRSGAFEIDDEEYKNEFIDDPPQRSFRDMFSVRIVEGS